ncbi:Ig-like domain-containing protein [Chryseolinea lacunae]|uniref:Ig-like domain-containing protein n=1 Tax=Chryseolinea lacunae TaxID=2801331 RepID=A0ABS1KZ10_9BACT|nr:Ig-like domain-containing protein [Chryseolinea lacunae]MBL0744654.1 hypothetical protein [Chryseolinea lacunae]
MKSIFLKAQFVLAISTIFVLSSCSDQNEPSPNVIPPEVILSTSTHSTTLWNTVKLTVTSTSDKGIDKVELKIDGVAVGVSTTSPYEFSWDTRNATDGLHTATVTVTDKSGDEKITEFKLTVQNTLLETKIDAGMLRKKPDWGYDERGFIFLSDEQGKVIIAQEFKNGDVISVKVPSFEGAEFTINEVIATPWNAAYTLTTITSTTHVGRGKWILKKSTPGSSSGSANVSFINRDANLDYLLHTNYLTSYFLNGTTASALNLLTSPSLLYVTSKPKDGSGMTKYHIFSSIVAGANPNALDLALVNKDLTQETISLPEGRTKGSLNIYGLHTANNTSQIYDIGARYSDDTKGKLTFQYPAEGFTGFFAMMRLTGPEYSSYNASNSKKPYDLVPLEGTLNASLAGRKATVSATGAMDLINLNLSHNHLNWTIFAEKSATTIVVPEIPAILNDVVNLNVDITDAGLTITGEDFPQIQDYKSYLDFVRASTQGYNDLGANYEGFKQLYKDIDN